MKVTIMGTKVDDKTVRLETQILETLTPETIEKTDSSLKPGETEVQQTAVTGYMTITYKYVTVIGETTRKLQTVRAIASAIRLSWSARRRQANPPAAPARRILLRRPAARAVPRLHRRPGSSGSSSSTSDPES